MFNDGPDCRVSCAAGPARTANPARGDAIPAPLLQSSCRDGTAPASRTSTLLPSHAPYTRFLGLLCRYSFACVIRVRRPSHCASEESRLRRWSRRRRECEDLLSRPKPIRITYFSGAVESDGGARGRAADSELMR